MLAFLWTLLGWPIARRCLPAGFSAFLFAPLLGWAVQTAVAAALLPWLGFGWDAVAAAVVLPMVLVWGWHGWRAPVVGSARVEWGLVALAGALACLPMAGVMPKRFADGVRLSAPIFDHSKIAIVDAIARSGLPPVNPFYGGPEATGSLAYYYWWHLSAAEWARLTGATGWTADAWLTWFTAFASLLLIAGIGQAITPRAGLVAMLLAMVGSLRPLTAGLERTGILLPATGLGGWLNQASWAPQHLAAGCLVVVAALLLAGLAEAPSGGAALTLACVIAVAFGSSAWVGGVVCVVGVPLATLVVASRLPMRRRAGFVALAAAAGTGALVLVVPLLRVEAAASLHRGVIVALAIFPVFGPAVAAYGWADVAGLPLLILIEFPVAATLGALGVWRARRGGAPAWQQALAAVAAAGLAICFWLRSTIDNNDLGWRAVLPALLVALPFAGAAALALWRQGGWRAVLACAPLLGLLGAWPQLRENVLAHPQAGAAAFGREAAVWREVRRIVPSDARIASDPRLDGGMTPWEANIGWALLSDRSSCYAGWATAHPFTTLPKDQLYATHQDVLRVFDGAGTASDLAGRLGCAYALLTPASPAWLSDPFARSPRFRQAGSGDGWRVYQAKVVLTH